MSVTDLGFGAFGCWGRQARLINRILFSLGLDRTGVSQLLTSDGKTLQYKEEV
jgi:hypothetical protein